MGRALILFVILLGLWWLLSGYTLPLILAFALASAALVAGMAVRMALSDEEGVPIHLVGRLLAYLPWLVREVWRSNLAVARIVVSRELPISPTLIKVPTTQRTELGRVVYGNSITLTPGTVTLRVGDDHLEVHALTREGAADLMSGEMDARVSRVEGS